ncbi:dnaJ homolog subfamily C member 7 homolog [Macrobrachium nipponense]|uniref:dnaJ homolog subfamily C member 7 homolog n=1 Tax=Macrobrachium nipponense TaxID=159736 RepID=UPI0030C87ECE
MSMESYCSSSILNMEQQTEGADSPIVTQLPGRYTTDAASSRMAATVVFKIKKREIRKKKKKTPKRERTLKKNNRKLLEKIYRLMENEENLREQLLRERRKNKEFKKLRRQLQEEQYINRRLEELNRKDELHIISLEVEIDRLREMIKRKKSHTKKDRENGHLRQLEKSRHTSETCQRPVSDPAEYRANRLICEGVRAFLSDSISDAINIFEEALTMDVTQEEEALLIFLNAKAKSASDGPDHLGIVVDVTKAMEKGLHGSRLLGLRGRHLLSFGLFAPAVDDFESAYALVESEGNLENVEEARRAAKKWEEQSHYEVLGVKQSATKQEILRAFRNLSMIYHPDRHVGKPEFLLKAFQEKMKRIAVAKVVLTDDAKRKKYDRDRRHDVDARIESPMMDSPDDIFSFFYWIIHNFMI